VLAVKSHGVDDGLVSARHEVEGPATGRLDPAEWPDSPARRELLDLTGGSPVVVIAILRQRRRVRIVRRGTAAVELSLDALAVLDGDRVAATRWELEAELKAGPRESLHELATALERLAATGPPAGSKLSFARTATRAP
jgi:inorganic triphosphatase YgiF